MPAGPLDVGRGVRIVRVEGDHAVPNAAGLGQFAVGRQLVGPIQRVVDERQVPRMLFVPRPQLSQQLVDARAFWAVFRQQRGKRGQRPLGSRHVAVVVLMAGQRDHTFDL